MPPCPHKPGVVCIGGAVDVWPINKTYSAEDMDTLVSVSKLASSKHLFLLYYLFSILHKNSVSFSLL